MQAPQPQTSETAKVLLWAGGVATTIAGSWIASKIRVYDDARKAHHEDLRQRVLVPLHKVIGENIPLFGHERAVVVESHGVLKHVPAGVTEDDSVYGMLAESVDPWPGAFEEIDRALFEDARRTHLKELLTEILTFSESWKAHAFRCMRWVTDVSSAVLAASKMNPYSPPFKVPYILHIRLGVFVYRRLFGLPTEPLRKQEQGQYWSIEGATTVPNVVGVSALAATEALDSLIQAMEGIVDQNRLRAGQLHSESKALRTKAVELRNKLELEIASKKLHHGCDLVRFF